ncbi:MAG: hypothetical protein L6416_03245 [Candidatus Omnitrophica bacterium]|nr:hypothetical protein [Candidatus Omnitrophota bacterium]
MKRYLYRGISEEMHIKKKGLKPKGNSFCREIVIGEIEDGGDGVVVGGGETVGKSKENAIIAHQRNSDRFPSLGVSTTPFLERAKIYATHKGLRSTGIVYKIDRYLFSINQIEEYRVREWANAPKFPEDDEVILVGGKGKALTDNIIAEVIIVK